MRAFLAGAAAVGLAGLGVSALTCGYAAVLVMFFGGVLPCESGSELSYWTTLAACGPAAAYGVWAVVGLAKLAKL